MFVAVAQEAENQRAEFKKQRNGYVMKTAILRRELQTLKEQSKEMHSGSAPPSPTTKGFIEENDKLRVTKLHLITNVDGRMMDVLICLFCFWRVPLQTENSWGKVDWNGIKEDKDNWTLIT